MTDRTGIAPIVALAVCVIVAPALALCVMAAPASGRAQSGSERYDGRPLTEVLRALQADGLRLVFSSKIVTSDMRVDVVTDAATPRKLLDQLLDPHGLVATTGPGAMILVTRKPVAKAQAPRARRQARRAIRGRVVDAATGNPLWDARVQVEGVDTWARTDQDGRFHLADVGSTADTLRVSMDGYTPATRALDERSTRTMTLDVALSRHPVTYREQLTVVPGRSGTAQPTAAGGTTLDARELRALTGVLAQDPLRAVQTLPGVAATDDFRAEFSVRGSPYRHLGVIIDGVATPWLRHTAPGRGDMGSLAMFSGDLLESATLYVGAQPQRHGNILGAQLGLTLREGSREAIRVRGALGGLNAAMTAEGPVGTSGRGSWLASVRQSYLDWPIRRRGESNAPVFGFADGLAKLVYDVTSTQQLSVTMLGGRSAFDEFDDRPTHEFGDGTNRTAVVNLGWRSMLGADTVLSQRAYLVDHRFIGETPVGNAVGLGAHRQLSYRADLFRSLGGGMLEAGGQVQRLRTVRPSSALLALDQSLVLPPADGRVGSSWLRSGYVHVAWSPSSRLDISPGVRVADSTSVARRAISPWVLTEWAMAPDWTLKAGASVSHQFPEFQPAFEGSGLLDLRPEQATHLDLGVERRLGESLRWQATVFWRGERDVLFARSVYPRLVDGRVFDSPGAGWPLNALSGSARGLELLIERRSPTGLTGWLAYSFGKARYTDATDGESFWGDFDQRHAITLSGVYRLGDRTVLAANIRGGSNFPIPGYLDARGDRMFVAERRNETRLPAYARLDVRASRSFTLAGRRVTLFAEILNVLNRTNLGAATGHVRPDTGEALDFTRAMLPRLPSAGLVVEF